LLFFHLPHPFLMKTRDGRQRDFVISDAARTEEIGPGKDANSTSFMQIDRHPASMSYLDPTVRQNFEIFRTPMFQHQFLPILGLLTVLAVPRSAGDRRF